MSADGVSLSALPPYDGDVPTSQPRVRLAAGTQGWLDAYTAARPRWDSPPPVATVPSRTAATNGAVDLRDDGAVVSVARAVWRVWQAEPHRSRGDVVSVVADSTGLSPAEVAAAMAYWAEQPDLVNALLHA